MLLSFLDYKDIPEVKEICDKLASLKNRIQMENTDDPEIEYESVKDTFEIIKTHALTHHDSTLADAQRVFRDYFHLFCNLAKFKQCLMNKSYRQSWDALQDCMNNAIFVGRFTPIAHRLDTPDIIGLLEDYECLYPYSFFFSSEFVISKSHCSICGKSMQSLECPHRRNQLYCGEVAVEVVDEIKEFQAVCLVKNPENKKCVIEKIDGEPLSFNLLEEFLDMNLPWLQRFSITTTIERRINPDIIMTDRNSPCTCGSGIKFKKCCGKDLYYDHIHCVVTPGKRINLTMLQHSNL